MKKRILFTTIVLGLLTFLVYVLIVGAVDYFISGSGSNYYNSVIWETTLNGTVANDQFGYSVATGDVNNDSYVDVIVGAFYAPSGSSDGPGQVFVFFGSADGISDMDVINANITLNGTAIWDWFGISVASGDVNNDSYDDVIVGAYDADPSGAGDYAGQAYVFFGADYTSAVSQDALSSANLTFNGTTALDEFGYIVASGDINNDSYVDIIVGADYADPSGASRAGQVFVFFGAGYPSTIGISYNALIDANLTFNGTTTEDYFSGSIASGDVNNDSYADVIVGAYEADPTLGNGSIGLDNGQAYVFFGADYISAVGISYNSTQDANLTFNGTTAGDFFGVSVASGDVNNDSYADIIVSANIASPLGATYAGQVFVFFGADYPGTVGISYNALIDANLTFNGTTANDNLGVSVSSGDVNNDRYADIIVGAYFANVSANVDAGQAYVFFGADYPSTVGISYNSTQDANLTFNGTTARDFFGYPVASGDVNNDSYVNVIVGARQAPYSGSAGPGRVYIFEYDDTNPVVSADGPADNSYDTDGDVNFSFTTIEVHPELCILWFRTNETNWAQNDSTAYSNNIQANIFVNLTDAVYAWSIYCNDTANNYNNTIENRTLTVDTVAPVTPTLTAPTDTSINPRDSISYTCQSSDATSGISKWTWTLTKPQSGGTVTKTGGDVSINSQTFSGDETNLAGEYTVVCEAEDKAGHKSSTSSTFSVFFSHPPEGAGPGAGPSAAAQLDFTIQEEVKIKEPQGAIMTFTLDGTAVHTIKLKEVTTKTVTVVIEPKFVEVTLNVGGTEEVDADGDGINNIGITLENIENGFAQIMIKKLLLPKEVEPVEEIVFEEVPEEVMPEEARVMVWPYVLAGLALALIISYLLLKKKK